MTATPFRPFALLAPALAATLLAACAPTASKNSATGFRGDQRQAAQTIEDLQSAGTDRDGTKVCRDLLTRALAAKLARGGRTCAATVKAALEDTDSADMTVESVRVSGSRATARVRLETGKRDRRTTISLAKEGGRWRVAGL